jgi:hypothetical protein
MKIRPLLFILTMVGASLPLIAQEEGNYLHVQTTTGWKVLDLDSVDRLSFNNGVMTASDKNLNTVETIPQDQLISMNYSETAGVVGVVAEEEADTFTFDRATKTAIMNCDGRFEVYTEAGIRLVEIPAARKGETIDLSDIRKGIVILKSGNKSVKEIIK